MSLTPPKQKITYIVPHEIFMLEHEIFMLEHEIFMLEARIQSITDALQVYVVSGFSTVPAS